MRAGFCSDLPGHLPGQPEPTADVESHSITYTHHAGTKPQIPTGLTSKLIIPLKFCLLGLTLKKPRQLLDFQAIAPLAYQTQTQTVLGLFQPLPFLCISFLCTFKSNDFVEEAVVPLTTPRCICLLSRVQRSLTHAHRPTHPQVKAQVWEEASTQDQITAVPPSPW